MRRVTGSPLIADFRCWTWPEVAILGADQKERGLWGQECDLGGKNGGVLSMRMQVILDSSFARPGSASIWSGKKGEFREWTRYWPDPGLVFECITCFFVVSILIKHMTSMSYKLEPAI